MFAHAQMPAVFWRATVLFLLLIGRALAQDGMRLDYSLAGTPVSAEAELARLAEAQFARGDIAAAISTHMALEDRLTGDARSANRDTLWKTLNTLPPGTDFSVVNERTARGWVELMLLAKSGAPLSAFEEWRVRYPDHPADSQIAAGLVMPAAPRQRSRQMGLLLPMTGQLAAAARAIKAGAEAAQGRAGGDALGLMVFDTTDSLEAAIASATAQGMTALIGPLRKEDVSSLAGRSLSMPVVTLNHLEGVRSAPPGMTLLGLAPEDEARAAAEHAVGESRLRAVLLSQEGDWGERVAAAFKAEFEARGGTIIAQESFKTNAVDFTRLLKRALGVSYSEARGDKLLAVGVKAELLPVPRGDIDVVYLAARSAQAKLIWPQMRYLRAGHIATYAPATAADSGSQDLGRLMVCDAPWRIETTGSIAALRGELAAANPRTADAQRLFALGYDAYTLARQVALNAPLSSDSIEGLTGTLVLEAGGSVHRRLDCKPISTPRVTNGFDDPAQ